MSNENLNKEEGIKKLKELAEAARVCMFCTELENTPVTARPMTITEVDDDGNLWFISGKDSNKNVDIQHDKRVQLFFMNNGKYEYLSVFGQAFIYTDKATIDEKWSMMANAMFEQGKDDSDVSLIRVQPSDTQYWDTKSGKMISFLSFAWAAITGKKTDDANAVTGNINI